MRIVESIWRTLPVPPKRSNIDWLKSWNWSVVYSVRNRNRMTENLTNIEWCSCFLNSNPSDRNKILHNLFCWSIWWLKCHESKKILIQKIQFHFESEPLWLSSVRLLPSEGYSPAEIHSHGLIESISLWNAKCLFFWTKHLGLCDSGDVHPVLTLSQYENPLAQLETVQNRGQSQVR